MYFYMKLKKNSVWYNFYQGTSVSITFYIFEHYQLWMMDSKAQRVFCDYFSDLFIKFSFKSIRSINRNQGNISIFYINFHNCYSAIAICPGIQELKAQITLTYLHLHLHLII